MRGNGHIYRVIATVLFVLGLAFATGAAWWNAIAGITPEVGTAVAWTVGLLWFAAFITSLGTEGGSRPQSIQPTKGEMMETLGEVLGYILVVWTGAIMSFLFVLWVLRQPAERRAAKELRRLTSYEYSRKD